MASVYTVGFADLTIIANATLVFIRTSAVITTRPSIIEILRASASQRGTATSGQADILIGVKASAFGTYVSATPAPHILGGVISGITGGTTGANATCGVNASAEGAGAVTTVFEDSFNLLNGWLWVPTPEERIIVPIDTAIVLKIEGTPPSLTAWHAWLTYREVN